ncbi:DUF4190 domain-containing protein [Leifsonia poae]|uniref:DUF4190 domain-containing protein n=1 Tax=Leifsonia poae TaxID=110933 RepID=A0A9W6M1U8_9MICO|nr:DUF4190 domain-containing protein [Leifsonia poae]GLJ78119.1 hypothetical protein GCM10017584_36930 [Leifsonia poae]
MSTPEQPPQQPEQQPPSQEPQSQQPQYAQQPAYPPAPQYGEQTYQGGAPQRGYNTMAIVGFILSFFISLVGIILGFIALSQIKKSGEQGRGFAIAAIIIGFAEIVLGIIFAIIFVAIAANVGYQYSTT